MIISSRLLAAALAAPAALGLLDPLPARAATAARSGCPAVAIAFARGTDEPPGLGDPGSAFAASLAADLPDLDVSAYAVNYPANITQLSAGIGANDMSDYVITLAAQCPSTLFVIGGYSQGATATNKAVGIYTGVPYFGATIPASLGPRLAAIATFGNPIHVTLRNPSYGTKWIDFCAVGDPVCAGGINFDAHLSYVVSGDTAAAAKFAAERVLASRV